MSQNHHDNKQDKEFYIATNNLLNFALPNRTFYSNMQPYSEFEYQRKLTGLYELLKNAKSDIYAFQEVWDEEALQDLAELLGFEPSQVLAPMASNDPSSALTSGKGAQDTPALGLISKFKVFNI